MEQIDRERVLEMWLHDTFKIGNRVKIIDVDWEGLTNEERIMFKDVRGRKATIRSIHMPYVLVKVDGIRYVFMLSITDDKYELIGGEEYGK